MKLKVIYLSSLILLLSGHCVFADWNSRPVIRLMQGYRNDFREDNHELYISRFSFTMDYFSEKKSLFKITPFFELRRNIQREQWERKEAGIEIGMDIFKWLYLGESIQKIWAQEDCLYRQVYEKRDHLEAETRLYLSHNLSSTKPYSPKVFVLNEFAYEFDKGAAVRNELAAGIIIPLNRYLETQLNWRHIDRIRYYDSDTAEASVTLIF